MSAKEMFEKLGYENDEVNDYVRTKWGYICKIININEFREPSMKYVVEASYLKDIMFIGDEEIIKSSPNIIDLIEVGDYVNGLKVQEVNNEIKGFGTIVFDKDNSIMEDYIYSIVTKEAFESMEYKIGDK